MADRAQALADLTGTGDAPVTSTEASPAGQATSEATPPVNAGGDVLITAAGYVTVAWQLDGVNVSVVLKPGESALVSQAQADRLTELGVTTDAPPKADGLTAEAIAGMSVTDVEAYAETHPAEAADILAAEQDGKARRTLIRSLEAMLNPEA